ncbi:hypothetical protein KBC70_02515 [Candidatus Woesebacteria bacterium]|nr:hypothetical protein [Candidatus Woesebacteria bacterium]
MKNNDRGQHKSILKISLIILALVSGVLFVSYASQTYLKKMSVQPGSLKSPEELQPEGKGIFSLRTELDRTVFEEKVDIEVFLNGHSEGALIGTFDSVFDELGSDLTLKKVSGVFPNFDVQTIDERKGWINGTLKDHEAPEGADLHFTDLALLTFVHSKPGPFTIGFDFTARETRDSNMMQMSPPIDVLAEAKGITLYTGSKMRLTQSTSHIIPKTDLSVTLKQTTIPGDQCYDCPISAEIEIHKGTKAEIVTLSLGGFDGRGVDAEDIFGYRFETSDIDAGMMDLYVAPLTSEHEK